jgi:RHS repeat-associated protein
MDGVRLLHCADATHTQDAFGRGQTKDTTPPCSLENKPCCGIPLITINYPGTGNFTSFTYDGFGHRVKIVEEIANAISSTKQFIFEHGGMVETRDSGGTSVLAQFYKYGENIGGADFAFVFDKLGSVRELNDASGNNVALYTYDPYGNLSKLKETVASDIQFAGYYSHSRSGLSLTPARAYSPPNARWLSRDPQEGPSENAYSYVLNNPENFVDSTGLRASHLGGLASLMAAIMPMYQMCGCCVDPSQKNQCKADAAKIVNALVFTWFDNYQDVGYWNWGKPGDTVGGQFCYDWANEFNSAIQSIGSSVWDSRVITIWKHDSLGRLIYLPDGATPMHAYVWLFVKDPQLPSRKCQLFVDDGFFNGGMLHLGPSYFGGGGSGSYW